MSREGVGGSQPSVEGKRAPPSRSARITLREVMRQRMEPTYLSTDSQQQLGFQLMHCQSKYGPNICMRQSSRTLLRPDIVSRHRYFSGEEKCVFFFWGGGVYFSFSKQTAQPVLALASNYEKNPPCCAICGEAKHSQAPTAFARLFGPLSRLIRSRVTQGPLEWPLSTGVPLASGGR